MTDYLDLKNPRTLPSAKDGLHPAAPTPPGAASSSPATRTPIRSDTPAARASISSRAPVTGASGTSASLAEKVSDGSSPAPSRARENIDGGQSDVLDDVNSQEPERESQEVDNFLETKMFDEEMDTEFFLGFANHLFKNYEILNENESLIDYLPQGFDRIILYKLIAAWCMNVDISVFHFLKERHFEEVYVSEQLNKRLIEYIQDKGELGAKVAALMEDCENINNEVEEIKDGSLKIVADYIESSEKKMQELSSQIQVLTNQISSGGVGAVAGPGVAGSANDDAAGRAAAQKDPAESGRMDSDNTLSDREVAKDRISPGKYAALDQGESATDANVEIDVFKQRYDSLIEKLNRGATPPPHHKKKNSLFGSRNKKARKDEALSTLDKFKCALLEKDLGKRQKDFLLRCAADGVDINILLKVTDRNINPCEMLGLIELYLKVGAP